MFRNRTAHSPGRPLWTEKSDSGNSDTTVIFITRCLARGFPPGSETVGGSQKRVPFSLFVSS